MRPLSMRRGWLTGRLARVLACALGAWALLAAAVFASPALAWGPNVYVGEYGASAVGLLTPFGTDFGGVTIGSPQALAITPDGQTLYVANWSAGTVTPVSLSTMTARTPISVGTDPAALAITPDGSKVYVANYNGNSTGSVSVIATATNTVVATVPVGKGPHGVAITPDGSSAYVVNRYDGTVTPISTATDQARSPIAVGTGGNVARPDAIAITPDGSTAYVADYGSSEIVPISLSTDTASAAVTGVTNPNAIAITPDGATAYIAEDGMPGHVVAMTLATRSLRMPVMVGNNPYAVGITPDGSTAYVPNYNNDSTGSVTPISLSRGTADMAIPTANGSNSVVIAPDQAPVASFTASPAEAGSASSFDASASTVKYGSIVSYAWSFGDGQTATTTTPKTSHTYTAPGSYTVTVTETDSAGTSTKQVFTGQTVARNGGPSAQATRVAQISSASSGSFPSPPPPPPPPPSSSSPPASPPPGTLVVARILTATPAGRVQIGLRCPASTRTGCTGTVTIQLAQTIVHAVLALVPDRGVFAIPARCARGCRRLVRHRLVTRRYSVRAGHSARLSLLLSSYGRKLLKRLRSLRVTVTASTAAGGHGSMSVRSVTLRASRG